MKQNRVKKSIVNQKGDVKFSWVQKSCNLRKPHINLQTEMHLSLHSFINLTQMDLLVNVDLEDRTLLYFSDWQALHYGLGVCTFFST